MLAYDDRPLVEVTAVMYGEVPKTPLQLTDPVVIPDDRGLGYTVDLSKFGIRGILYIRLDQLPAEIYWKE